MPYQYSPLKFDFSGKAPDPRDSIFRNLLFQQQEPELPNPVVNQQPPDFMQAYSELMNRKSGPAMEGYRKYLDDGFPDENEFKPSKMTRLSAILSGAAASFSNPGAGAGIARDIVQEPYKRAVQKYQFQGERLREAAALEDKQDKDRLIAVDRMMDNQRQGETARVQAKTAEVLNRSRELGMQKTTEELKLIGWKFNTDSTSGNMVGINTLTGEKKDFGKVDAGEEDRVREAGTKLKDADKVTTARQIKMSGINFGQQKTLQEDRQAHDVTMESQRDKNRDDAAVQRDKAALERIAERAKVKPTESNVNRIRGNQAKAHALAKADPRYAKWWDSDAKDIKAAPDSASPEYQDYVKLFNTLNEGFTSLSTAPVKKIGGYRIQRER